VLRFIAYGDIHHDRRAARCVTLDDTLTVERQIHHRVAHGGFDFSVFTGDRYLKREPEDEVKVRADRVLAECLQMRPNAPHYHLIGNHDWTKNNREWHTSESLKGLGNLVVLDEADSIDSLGRGYMIHALPADVPFDESAYAFDRPEDFNLFLFHGIVKGSLMADGSDRTFEDGIDVTQIDRSEFDFVLGGDIHVPQTIPFTNTRGGYTGSVVQRTRADADRPRGWLEVAVQPEGDGYEVTTQFVPTRNFFHREVWQVLDDTQFEDIRVDETFVSDQAVEVRLTGNRRNVDRVADDKRWSNYLNVLGARSFDLIRDYEVEQSEAVVDLSASSSVFDDLELYLKSDFVNLGTMSSDKIFEMVKRMQEA